MIRPPPTQIKTYMSVEKHEIRWIGRRLLHSRLGKIIIHSTARSVVTPIEGAMFGGRDALYDSFHHSPGGLCRLVDIILIVTTVNFNGIHISQGSKTEVGYDARHHQYQAQSRRDHDYYPLGEEWFCHFWMGGTMVKRPSAVRRKGRATRR